jgi:hypothetical protein
MRRLRNKFPDDGLSESQSESIVKTSLVFLGAVGAATLAAHKFWPKGITYGEKEEWECVEEKKKVRKAKRDAEDDRAARGDGGRPRGAEASSGRAREGGGGGGRRGGDDGRYVAGAGAAGAAYAGSSASSGSGRGRDVDRDGANYRRDERNGGRGGGSAAGGYYVREEMVVQDKSVGADVARSRSRPAREPSMERTRVYREADRIEPPLALPPTVVERQSKTQREVGYYPPSPPRSLPESTGRSSRDRSRSIVYTDEPEVVYVRREPGQASRYVVGPGSVAEVRARSRYGDDYYR